MKLLLKGNDKEQALINRELKIHKNLIHKNIIQLKDSLETASNTLIFLEHASNGDLFGHIHKKKLTEKQLLKLFFQVCLAVKYLHERDIMHRDIKPENILIDGDFNAKLCDFGWSAEFKEGERRLTICGTYEYMAPEVFFRERQTKKMDVWALGVLLFEMFHGRAPYRGTRMDSVMNAIMKNIVAFKKGINSDIKRLIIDILIFDPKKRPTVNDILNNKLFEEFMKEERALEQKKVVDKENDYVRYNKNKGNQKRNRKIKIEFSKSAMFKKEKSFLSQSKVNNEGNNNGLLKKKLRIGKSGYKKNFGSIDKFQGNFEKTIYNLSKYNRNGEGRSSKKIVRHNSMSSSFFGKNDKKPVKVMTNIYDKDFKNKEYNSGENKEGRRMNTFYNRSFSSLSQGSFNQLGRDVERSFGGYFKGRRFKF